MFISSGGVANSTTVNSGGYMYIYAGGVANSTTMSGGRIFISSGGVHHGDLQIADGAVVSAYSGAIIDFTVAKQSADDDYLINNLSLISGAPTYTITVAENQAYGTYELAQGAENFTGTIAVTVGGTLIGNLSANGAAIVSNGISYQLINNSGWLGLEVTKADSMLDEAVAESTSLIAADAASADDLYIGESLIYPADTALGAASVESLTSQDTDKSKFALIA